MQYFIVNQINLSSVADFDAALHSRRILEAKN
jgi:hypothetical protein